MIGTLLNDQLRRNGLSIREAARQVGVSHTTLVRIGNGDQPDLETLTAICRWMGITVTSTLNADGVGIDALAAKIALIIERNPSFARAFACSTDRLQDGMIEIQLLEDVLAYLSYRIDMSDRS